MRIKPKDNARIVEPYRLGFFVILIAIGLNLIGCSTIQLVSDYDEVLDKGVTEVQKKCEIFLAEVEKNGRAASDTLTSQDSKFFDEMQVAISSLLIRAKATPKSEITVKMLESLKSSIDTLKSLVLAGIEKDQVNPIRSAINTSTGAILKFEIAKKRGE